MTRYNYGVYFNKFGKDMGGLGGRIRIVYVKVITRFLIIILALFLV